MRCLALLICLTPLAPLAALAQSAPPAGHQSTSPPAGARFEMLQSAIDAKWTFRLDRFGGRVWMMTIEPKDDSVNWQEMLVIDAPKVSGPPRARFQLFSSGIAARHTFLLDGDSGKTWMAVVGRAKRPDGSPFEGPLWQPVGEPAP